LALAGCVIFAGQVLLSRAILRHFHQGPLEALWRRATYGRRAPYGEATDGEPPAQSG
jgi:uncharacterized membrane protein YeiB